MTLARSFLETPRAGIIAALATVTVWSGWIVATRHAATHLPLPAIVLLRFGIPSLILMPVILRTGLLPRGVSLPVLATLVAGSGTPFLLIVAIGMRTAPAAEVAPLLPGTMPLFVALITLALGRERFSAQRGAGFAMNANSKEKDAAWAFMQYLCGPEGQIAFTSGASAAVPAMTGNPKVVAAFKAPFAEVFLSETKNGDVLPQFPKYVDILNNYIQPALDKVWSGEDTAADALGAIKDQVNAQLASSN